MDKNRLEGRHGPVSWHKQATNRSAVVSRHSSGLPVEINVVVVKASIVPLPGEWERSGNRRSGGEPREG